MDSFPSWASTSWVRNQRPCLGPLDGCHGGISGCPLINALPAATLRRSGPMQPLSASKSPVREAGEGPGPPLPASQSWTGFRRKTPSLTCGGITITGPSRHRGSASMWRVSGPDCFHHCRYGSSACDCSAQSDNVAQLAELILLMALHIASAEDPLTRERQLRCGPQEGLHLVPATETPCPADG